MGEGGVQGVGWGRIAHHHTLVCLSTALLALLVLWPCCRSVPSGRVGPGPECVWRDNEAWRGALAAREERDVAELEAKMGRR